MSHEAVTATDRFLTYDHHPGILCDPPRQAVKISLHSKTYYTMIYCNSTTKKNSIRNAMKSSKPINNIAMERVMEPESTKTGSIQRIALALEWGTLQGASGGSVKNKIGTSVWVIEPHQQNGRSKHSMFGAGPVDGDSEYLNLTRAERSGFLGPLFCV